MWEAYAIKTYDSHMQRNTCQFDNAVCMKFFTKEYMSILYVGYIHFPTNRFIRNFCP
jgi:hypothetical protein